MPYHPSANGLVERFHHSLKQALRCHDSQWTESLPIVLLGLQSAFKEDINGTYSEMVYGTTIRLPAEFLSPSPAPQLDPASFLHLETLCRCYYQPQPLLIPIHHILFIQHLISVHMCL